MLDYLSQYFTVSLNDYQKIVYLRFFQKISPEAMSHISSEIIRKFKYFPKISELQEMLHIEIDNKSLAIQWVGDIYEAIRRFGRYQASSAREYLGNDKWEALNCVSDYYSLCNSDFTDSTLRAQLRDACKSIIDSIESKKNNEKYEALNNDFSNQKYLDF